MESFIKDLFFNDEDSASTKEGVFKSFQDEMAAFVASMSSWLDKSKVELNNILSKGKANKDFDVLDVARSLAKLAFEPVKIIVSTMRKLVDIVFSNSGHVGPVGVFELIKDLVTMPVELIGDVIRIMLAPVRLFIRTVQMIMKIIVRAVSVLLKLGN